MIEVFCHLKNKLPYLTPRVVLTYSYMYAFLTVCRNAAEYEKAVVSEAKYQVAFEVMNYQAAASGVEAHHLAEEQLDSLPAASTYNIDTFEFNYLTLNDSDTLKVSFISIQKQIKSKLPYTLIYMLSLPYN